MHNDISPQRLPARPLCLTRVAEELTRGPDAFPSGLSRARHVRGAGPAPGVVAGTIDLPHIHRSPTSFVQPAGHLTDLLLDLFKAFCGAVRKKFHCSDCLECKRAH